MSRENPALQTHIATKKKITPFDTVVVIASFLYPLSGLPQVFQIFRGSTEGVSLYSWISFTLFSTIFLAYGLKHNIKPMIITNSIWFVIDSLVIIGLLINR